jgi:hypothetical protein
MLRYLPTSVCFRVFCRGIVMAAIPSRMPGQTNSQSEKENPQAGRYLPEARFYWSSTRQTNTQNANLPQGPAFPIVSGGPASLDSFHIGHAPFEGVEIHYDGNPVILESVLFRACPALSYFCCCLL